MCTVLSPFAPLLWPPLCDTLYISSRGTNSCLIFDPSVRYRLRSGGGSAAVLHAPRGQPRRFNPHSQERAMTNICGETSCLLSGETAGQRRGEADGHTGASPPAPVLLYPLTSLHGDLSARTTLSYTFQEDFLFLKRNLLFRCAAASLKDASLFFPSDRWISSPWTLGDRWCWTDSGMCICFLCGTV